MVCYSPLYPNRSYATRGALRIALAGYWMRLEGRHIVISLYSPLSGAASLASAGLSPAGKAACLPSAPRRFLFLFGKTACHVLVIGDLQLDAEARGRRIARSLLLGMAVPQPLGAASTRKSSPSGNHSAICGFYSYLFLTKSLEAVAAVEEVEEAAA